MWIMHEHSCGKSINNQGDNSRKRYIKKYDDTYTTGMNTYKQQHSNK